ncbi:HD domain-containing phosphohydrolase [Synechocystis sp. LKSZ1]|uniref:HD domain-containing phosphohydrolase n=1 Tax=Synechocystis sp. LKSZ1 TaxID=3144951 RepID=UPI00336BE2A2
MKSASSQRILIIDGHPYSRVTATDILLLENYSVLESDGHEDLLSLLSRTQPDLILLDAMMPSQEGLGLCQTIKQTATTAMIPVILMSALDDPLLRHRSREVGADAYLLKPLDRVELLARIEVLIQKKQLAEWVEQIEQVLFRVAQAIEHRYPETSPRPSFSTLVEGFARFLHLPESACQDLIFAARLHDLGTVTIPDAVMLKQGGLTAEERALVKQHVLVGEKIFEPLAYRREVGQIMRHHHERWDGSGYPDQLKGAEIPYLAQVFQVIDIFSALTSDRSYKAAISTEAALKTLEQEAQSGWRNPDLVEKFALFMRQACPQN